MRTVFRLLAVVVVVGAVGPPAAAQRAVLLVRHAEKADDGKDPALSREGEARAEALAGALRDAGVTAIVTSEYRRCVQTAAPLARALGVTPYVVPARDVAGLVALLREKHGDGVVLVVGHSNTIPAILRALGHEGDAAIPDDRYGDVFVVTRRAEGPPVVLRLRL
jgi:broad specificity phosphatase PhoE